MGTGENNFKALKDAEGFVLREFPHFGVNKKQELIRLLFEITKRDGLSPDKIIRPAEYKNFDALKTRLLAFRYPSSFGVHDFNSYYLAALNISPDNSASTKREFNPKYVFYDKAASVSTILARFKERFPKASYKEIYGIKHHIKSLGPHTIAAYNKRSDYIFIAKEKYDFFKRCPCTKGAASCGYHIFNLGFGCIYECSYCYLQEYVNSPGIILPANISDYFDALTLYGKAGMRLGSGEFADSLMIDDITGYSQCVIEHFRKHKGIWFEFKTKSSNIHNLLKTRHAGNIVVSWSLNPVNIVRENEFLSAPLNKRVNAASSCAAAGYKVGFHFDPIIRHDGWEKNYRSLIEFLFSKIKPKDIAWISLGTLRFKPAAKKVIEERFPANTILDEELIIGYDGKLRYPVDTRRKIYKAVYGMLREHAKRNYIYLCMEDSGMVKEVLKP